MRNRHSLACPSLVLILPPASTFPPQQQISLFKSRPCAPKTLQELQRCSCRIVHRALTRRSAHPLICCQSWQLVRKKAARIRQNKKAPGHTYTPPPPPLKAFSDGPETNGPLRAPAHAPARAHSSTHKFTKCKKCFAVGRSVKTHITHTLVLRHTGKETQLKVWLAALLTSEVVVRLRARVFVFTSLKLATTVEKGVVRR